jgi:hypothetical protein
MGQLMGGKGWYTVTKDVLASYQKIALPRMEKPHFCTPSCDFLEDIPVQYTARKWSEKIRY